MTQFKLPPISTLAGSTLLNFFKVLLQGKASPKYYIKVFYKKRVSKLKFEKPPLFILGHWRSGTTLLYNMLCSDSETGYVTTYRSFFPNNLGSKLVFKSFMRKNTLRKRPSDNVQLDVDFPQEDEFAFSNMQHNAYFNFFYFPERYITFYERAVHHKGLSEKEKEL